MEKVCVEIFIFVKCFWSFCVGRFVCSESFFLMIDFG